MPTDTPTGRDLDAALARLLGWTDVQTREVERYGGTVTECVGLPPGRKVRSHPPLYSTSLDALARDVEPEIARRGLGRVYMEELVELIRENFPGNPKTEAEEDAVTWDVLTAPAPIRAAAAWRVLSEAESPEGGR